MNDNNERSGPAEDGREKINHEHGSEKPSVSRRDVLKRGAYAAPAIMAVGSLPSFASNGSPGGGENGGDNDNGGSGSHKDHSHRKGDHDPYADRGWFFGFWKHLFG